MTTISRVETFLVAPRWLFVRIETDSGLVGWGEATCEGRSETVRTAVDQLAELLVGRDALRIEDHWQVLTKGSFYRGGAILASAVSGIDQALWDIAGEHLGAPVHQLLGGAVRDRIRVYAWVGGDEPAQVADAIAAQCDAGMTAVKMNASGRMRPLASVGEVDGVVARVAAAREVLGDHRDVAVDFHGRFTLATARAVAHRLEEYRPFFLEEPVTPENSHLIGRFVDWTMLPVSTGERLFNRQEFLPVLQAGIAVAQPDLSHAGGITEVRKIAALAETFDVALAPHCPLGPLALAASLQVGFATYDHLIELIGSRVSFPARRAASDVPYMCVTAANLLRSTMNPPRVTLKSANSSEPRSLLDVEMQRRLHTTRLRETHNRAPASMGVQGTVGSRRGLPGCSCSYSVLT